ncbi:photosystem II assembly protein [Fischerella thermalis CCMEE 5268]|uniref:Photosystem II assembly protein n=1 Tax=Fischerella thermalis CCMEE 5268 TaxID=2019662 RepID=A0A2N6KL97_9CYAN|nr:photosystem II assembly protein [Fischerella thermalis]PMB00587.1 photosystem II assembly protein [Fischerella thermalis CCMEE 5268]
MNKFIANWWRSQQFKLAISRGNTRQAMQLLQEMQKSGARLSWLEKLFRDKLQLEIYSQQYKQEVKSLKNKLNDALQELENINTQEQNSQVLVPEQEFIESVYKNFNLKYHDQTKLQCTGINQDIFNDLEENLIAYLQDEFSKIPQKQLKLKLEDALEDINNLKIGRDPSYAFSLTPHVYFMKYFLENVYCLYLTWFLVYEAGLLPKNVNILDIAAGPGTVAYGLALFLQSSIGLLQIPQMHISYYSLEKQDAFQYRGLQFWRRYIESRKTLINAYFRFVTDDIFNFNPQSSNLPEDFFDFIIISHCFFLESQKKQRANSIYQKIINTSIRKNGYVILIIQDKKLFKSYDMPRTEDISKEQYVVNQFVSDLDLELVWYRYLTSRDSRKPCSAMEFAKFADEKLPKQLYMTSLIQKYFDQRHNCNYKLDDYIIIAKK